MLTHDQFQDIFKNKSLYTKPYIWAAVKITPVPTRLRRLIDVHDYKYSDLIRQICRKMQYIKIYIPAKLSCPVSVPTPFHTTAPTATYEMKIDLPLCETSDVVIGSSGDLQESGTGVMISFQNCLSQTPEISVYNYEDAEFHSDYRSMIDFSSDLFLFSNKTDCCEWCEQHQTTDLHSLLKFYSILLTSMNVGHYKRYCKW